MHQPQQRHLHVVAGLVRAANLLLGAGQQVEPAQQVLARPAVHQREQALAIPIAHHVGVRRARLVHRQDEQVAHRARELAAQELEVVAALDGALGERERRGGVLGHDGVEHVEHEVAADQPEHRDDIFGGDGVAGEGPHLVEGAQRVAHAALARARQQHQRLVRRLDVLLVGDIAQPLGHGLRGDGAELVHLRSRKHGVGDLVQLGGRHHEDDVRRRLLDGLEEGVERRGREHVDLVDDEDLVAVAHRGDGEPLDDDLADVVDAGVRGGVDLEHVDVASFGNLDAGVALAARLGRGPLHAVECAGQDARAGGLAAPARAGEHERVGNPPALERVPEGLRDSLLAEHVVETLGPPLAGEYLVGHGRAARCRF